MIMDHKLPASTIIGPETRLHPSLAVGEGTIIRGEVVIRSEVQLGRYCVVEGLPGRKTVVESGSVLEDFVRVYPGVTIGERSYVGSYTILGHPSKAEMAGRDDSCHSERVQDLLVPVSETRIGSRAIIRSHSVIYSHVLIDVNLVTGHHIMIREHTQVGEGCIFGTYASIDGYCRIGPLSHIGQYAQLSQAARIGRGVFIGGHTIFSDNKQIIFDVAEDLFGATIEDYVRIGLGCVILPDTRIQTNAMIGAGSVVTRDVPERALAYGNPARISRELSSQETQRYVSSVEATIKEES